MEKCQNSSKIKDEAFCTQQIKITLLMMGSAQSERIFWSKSEAREYFIKHQNSVICYPLVEVAGKEFKNIAAARKFFKVKSNWEIPWANQKYE